MKAAKRSSIRKAASFKRKRTARSRASARKRTGSRVRRSKAVATPRSSRSTPATRTRAKGLRARIPALLMEGDAPGTPSPLQRATASAPAIKATTAPQAGKPLPEAYGTRRLTITPRDPHWIHAHWDFTHRQLREAVAQSAEGHLVLRLFEESTKGPLVSETHVHPESVRWLVHAPQPAMPYAAEIGFYNKRHQWSALAVAGPVRTPPAGPSRDQRFAVATLTPEGKLQRHETVPILKRPRELPETMAPLRGDALSSAEAGPEGPAAAAGGLPGLLDLSPSSPGVSSWSSVDVVSSLDRPMEGKPRPAFRLEVNAELVVYGATEPNATLQVGDRPVPLGADGTFRARFSLPDGTYDLPVKATAAVTGEQRMAGLRFSRQTHVRGDVRPALEASGLKPPAAENL